MRLVLPTARSPTTLIFSLRRRSRKDSATPLPGSKGLRDDYQPFNSAKRTLGRDRTGGNPSRARGGIGFLDYGLGRRREDHVGPGELQGARLGRPRRDPETTRRAAPAAQRNMLGGPVGIGVLAFVFSIASGLVALALQFIGQRRRAQFFEQLGVA